METAKIIITERLVSSFTDLILFLTFVALLWYTWETRRMRREIVSQTKIQSTPFITVFALGEFGSYPYGWWVRNDGEGTAINIEFKALGPYAEKLPTFSQIEVLPKGEKMELVGSFTRVDLEMLGYAKETIPFELKYKNILNEPYHAHVVFKDGMLSIKKFSKRI